MTKNILKNPNNFEIISYVTKMPYSKTNCVFFRMQYTPGKCIQFLISWNLSDFDIFAKLRLTLEMPFD